MLLKQLPAVSISGPSCSKRNLYKNNVMPKIEKETETIKGSIRKSVDTSEILS